MNYLSYYEVIFNGCLLATFEAKSDAKDWCDNNGYSYKYIIRKK